MEDEVEERGAGPDLSPQAKGFLLGDGESS